MRRSLGRVDSNRVVSSSNCSWLSRPFGTEHGVVATGPSLVQCRARRTEKPRCARSVACKRTIHMEETSAPDQAHQASARASQPVPASCTRSLCITLHAATYTEGSLALSRTRTAQQDTAPLLPRHSTSSRDTAQHWFASTLFRPSSAPQGVQSAVHQTLGDSTRWCSHWLSQLKSRT